MISGDAAVGRPILTAPDVPAARVQALRKAFDDTMRDPAFQEAAKKAGMYFNAIGGEELQQIVTRIVSPSPASDRAGEGRDPAEEPADPARRQEGRRRGAGLAGLMSPSRAGKSRCCRIATGTS